MATTSRTTRSVRTVYHVMLRDGQWVVTREGRPDGEYDAFETTDEAITRARRQAQLQTPSRVIVHKTDGTIETDFTYGNDPSARG